MKPLVSVIIPTWNNPQFLNPCIDSITATGLLSGLGELIIVNNGSQPIKDYVKDLPSVRVLEPGKNLGWEHGLQYGLESSEAEFVCFQNDDTHIPKASGRFYDQLLTPFYDATVGAVGPQTTVAAGWHSTYLKNSLRSITEVSYLIFFTVMLRRKYLDEVGGIDTSCPGGDDIDLSIRLRQAGKKLLVNPGAFLIHHAFKTGERVRGGADTPGGWNSKEMTDRTNHFLIKKHGFKTYLETMRGLDYSTYVPDRSDKEGDMVRSLIRGSKIVEVGCGFRKTVPHSVGVDRVENGESSPHIGGESVADIQADVTLPLPFADLTVDAIIARHILEHCLDSVQTLRNWNRVLKLGGQMIIAVPDQRIGNTIPMNPEHIHAFTPESLKTLISLSGFKEVSIENPMNGISFIGVYEKVLHVVAQSNGKVEEYANV